MEAPNKMVLPGEVNIISYCAPGSAHHRPVRQGETLVPFFIESTIHIPHSEIRILHLN